MATDQKFFFNEYKKFRQQVDELEARGEGESKNCAKLRTMMINVWNKMTPPQQKEIAYMYLPE